MSFDYLDKGMTCQLIEDKLNSPTNDQLTHGHCRCKDADMLDHA